MPAVSASPLANFASVVFSTISKTVVLLCHSINLPWAFFIRYFESGVGPMPPAYLSNCLTPSTMKIVPSNTSFPSALCLNTRGLDAFVNCNPFDRLFHVMLSPDYLLAMRRRRSSDPLGRCDFWSSVDGQRLFRLIILVDMPESVCSLFSLAIICNEDGNKVHIRIALLCQFCHWPVRLCRLFNVLYFFVSRGEILLYLLLEQATRLRISATPWTSWCATNLPWNLPRCKPFSACSTSCTLWDQTRQRFVRGTGDLATRQTLQRSMLSDPCYCAYVLFACSLVKSL